MHQMPLGKTNYLTQTLFFILGIGVFLLPLLNAWHQYPLGIENNLSIYAALGGEIPWSDAAGYYDGANYFLDTGNLNAWNTRRPLNALLFAVRLFLTNNNFYAALILQAALCGIASLLVVKSIIKTFGKTVGIIAFFILFLYACVLIPTTLSEILGLTLGCLGFTFLWQAIQTPKNHLFFHAAFLLMIGLNTRAGAFLILPLLIIWLAYRFKLKTALVFILGLLAGILFNGLLIKLYGDTTAGAMHSNFSHTVFGLVSGGKMWSYANTVFPEILTKTESEVARFLYAESFEQFKKNPFLLLLGIFRGLAGAIKYFITFFQQYNLPHSFILKSIIRISGALFLVFSVYRLKRLYKIYPKETGFMAISFLGIFLSAGIIWTDGGFRVFAATIPFVALAIGMVFKSQRKPLVYNNKLHLPQKSIMVPTYLLSYLLLIAGMLGPLYIIKTQKTPKLTSTLQCAANETVALVQNLRATPHLHLNQGSSHLQYLISHEGATENKKAFLALFSPSVLDKTPVLGLAYNLKSHTTQYFVGPISAFSTTGYSELCVTELPENFIFQIQSFGAARDE